MVILERLHELLQTPLFGTSLSVGNLLWLVVILALSVILARLTVTNLRRALENKISKNELEILLKLIYFTIVILGVVIALPNIIADLSGLLVAGGILGIIIGFASQSVVSNFVSGLFLMAEQPVKIGDNVNVGSISGNVEDICILSTTVRTYDGVFVRIPNEKVFNSEITNYWANVARRFDYMVGIRYQDDAGKAIGIIKNVLKDHPFVLQKPSPTVFVEELGDNGVNITVKIWSPARVWWDVKIELLWKIKVALEAEGIEIPFPQRTVWFPEPLKMDERQKVPYEKG
ncbi:MAG: mechanosensitive ion channel family protein [Methanomicrobiaceae archaeon]|nr:mechanosensitive ion channel family protein [Methanomicrobiaceae archaeon]